MNQAPLVPEHWPFSQACCGPLCLKHFFSLLEAADVQHLQKRRCILFFFPNPKNAMCFVLMDKRVAGILESLFPFPVSQQFLFAFPILDLLKGSGNL